MQFRWDCAALYSNWKQTSTDNFWNSFLPAKNYSIYFIAILYIRFEDKLALDQWSSREVKLLPKSRFYVIMQGSHTFSKTLFCTFQYLFNSERNNFNTITSLHFSKILFMEHKAKNICKTVINGNEQNFNKKWLNLEFPYYFNTLFTFGPKSTLFQGLENRFNNSILPILLGNPDYGGNFVIYQIWGTFIVSIGKISAG